MRLHLSLALFFWPIAVLGTQHSFAAPYPEKPIRMIVPWSPGGGSDVAGRIFAAKLTEALTAAIPVMMPMPAPIETWPTVW